MSETAPDKEKIKLLEARRRFFEECVDANDLSLVTCNHYVKDPSKMLMGHPSQGYSEREAKCHICKFPTSVQLPIYGTEVLDKLYQTAGLEANRGELSTFIDLHIKAYDTREASKYFSEEAYKAFDSVFLAQTGDTTLSWTTPFFCAVDFWREPKDYPQLEHCSKASARVVIANGSIRSLLEYSEIRGAAEVAQELGEVYSGVYLTTYIVFFLTATIPDHRKIWDKSLQDASAAALFMINLISKFSSLNLDPELLGNDLTEFLQFDVNELYLAMITNLVNFCQLISEFDGSQSGLRGSAVRRDH